MTQSQSCTNPVGGTLQVEGWAADVFCIGEPQEQWTNNYMTMIVLCNMILNVLKFEILDRGTALDNRFVNMVQSPEDHTLYCLVDVCHYIHHVFSLLTF